MKRLWLPLVALATLGPLSFSMAGQQTSSGGVTARTVQSGSLTFCTSASGTDTYTCIVQSLAAYTTGMVINFRASATANTDGATVNINGLGAKAIKAADGTTDPATGDIAVGQYYQLTYDGTVFRMESGGSGSGTVTSVTGSTGITVTGTAADPVVEVDDSYVATLGGNNTYTGTRIDTPSTAQDITAVGETILCDRTNVQITSDASYTLTSAPTIANGTEGQVCRITNTDASFTITLQHQDTLASSNLILLASTIGIRPGETIELHYINGDWRQIRSGPSTAYGPYVIKAGAPQTSTTSTSANNAMATITIPANTLAVGDLVRCEAWWTKVGANGTLSTNITFGGTSTTAVPNSAAELLAVSSGSVAVTGASAQRAHGRMHRSNGTYSTASGLVSPAAAINASITMTINGWVASASDTLTLEYYSCEVAKAR